MNLKEKIWLSIYSITLFALFLDRGGHVRHFCTLMAHGQNVEALVQNGVGVCYCLLLSLKMGACYQLCGVYYGASGHLCCCCLSRI